VNRAQRRANNEKAEMWTTPQVAAMLRKEQTKVLHKLANDYSAVVAMVLRDKLGYGHKRSKRVLTAISEMFADIQDGRLSVEDIKQTLGEEIGVVIK
jgi:hypothetical protein